MKIYTLLLSILIVAFTSCLGISKNETEIVILTTNDIHGRIDNFGKLSAYVKKMQGEHKHVFVFNAGDVFSGNPLVDQYPERGYPIIDIMNHVGYQLSNFGNHEFDYGQDELAKRIAQAKFPFIVANASVTDSSSPLPEFVPYHNFEIDGVKITVLSVIEVGAGGTPSTHPDRVKGITFYDPIKKMLEHKNLRENCDVFIGLTHIGTDVDIKLAEAMPELDVILGGHSHTRISEEMVVNGVLITQAESWLKYVGQTSIVVKNGKVIRKSNKLIKMSDLKDIDPVVQKVIDEYKDKDPGNVVIGKTLTNIKGKEALGALMTDAITDGLGMDIAFLNVGGIRVDEIRTGNITLNDIYTLDPFGNDVVQINMTGKEVKALIESTLRRTKGSTLPDLIVSGLTYKAVVVPKTGDTKSITISYKDGNLLDMARTYSVGINSYIYTKYKFDHADAGKSLNITSSQALINYIKQKQTIDGYNKASRIEIKHF